MKVKKFVAEDFQSAIYQAKREMGKDAIILNTRQIKKKGLWGWFGKAKFEVTVAIDDDLRVETDRNRRPVIPIPNPAIEERSAEPPEGIPDPRILQDMQQMKLVMDDIRGKLYEVELMKGLSQPIQMVYETLLENRVDQQLALRIVNSVENRLPNGKITDLGVIKEIFLRAVSDSLGEVKPIEVDGHRNTKVVVMIGPTGVGKTTTIAKLAANMVFAESRQVGLITMDTYRVSAAEQLRTFADIIGVPIKVVFSPEQLQTALNEFVDRDLVFIDTAGRSPYNREHMDELERFLQIARPDEVILVLSVATESSELLNTYERFNNVGVDKIIFTKLDETDRYGQIINVLSQVHKPVAYFTTGQNVPDDIEVPDPVRFASMVLRKDAAQ